jgi:hypothetical protein
MSELLIGCGNSRQKKLSVKGRNEWSDLVTLDIDPDCTPNLLGDASDPNYLDATFRENFFDEVHAYDVMEHFGKQGDWRYFFRHWTALWRILKPDGLFFGISPDSASRWAWGDPGHSRVIAPESLVYLSQAEYVKQIGNNPMTDYRHIYTADFEVMVSQVDPRDQQHAYILKAIKP